MKKVMPFVQLVRENLAAHGECAFDVACRFDQNEVLQQVRCFILFEQLISL
ncbi:unnamed protein product [Gongylonema pulchrum]|uniref:Transcriptional regulator n=1 Tax=Gongylonema pulchrum TaxID=637853 RepID=A0A183E3R5_9BILA|nr:unnamed protein product [Gongylonema pulchrum]